MSFVRRSDGTVVYSGGHVGSRGSLESIKYGGAEDFSELSEEDKEWEMRVLASAIDLNDSFHTFYCEDGFDCNIDLNLWGLYSGCCPHLTKRFNKGYFSPNGR
jgi:hypothetical protein